MTVSRNAEPNDLEMLCSLTEHPDEPDVTELSILVGGPVATYRLTRKQALLIAAALNHRFEDTDGAGGVDDDLEVLCSYQEAPEDPTRVEFSILVGGSPMTCCLTREQAHAIATALNRCHRQS